MQIGIGHEGAVIKFISNGYQRWIFKQHVKSISIAKTNMIRIDLTGERLPLTFYYSDVFLPITSEPTQLISIIMHWVSYCTCREEIMQEEEE